MKAVIVLSGGLDSSTCMGIAKDAGYELYPITFHYEQRHEREVECAKQIAAYYGVSKHHRIVNLSFFQQLGGSSLTDKTEMVQTDGITDQIPNTYVPARNMIFLSLATAYAEVIGAKKIYTGVSSVDYSGYPDCRPEFIESMNQTINLATKVGVTSEEKLSIETPIIQLSKAETIKLGAKLQVPYHLTTSCYIGAEAACGVCDSCRLRLKGFEEAGIRDPIDYQ
ncbi:7-cyano-7-deazaguanine synthase QueC [Shimazuella sp. AN120528]|uniref:7-cyano-7-deazaguanine synthase QueC n=1 Tax=Shimazuella soli TaxID=1892854 RepID=UPI001F10D210|nr:7-cyano-7-deazaguanine synthase QueC [Shimazuella soli]MCH5583422.1 7-cyano-7-deazaguanine synthase QueC [Shimazuella soli]